MQRGRGKQAKPMQQCNARLCHINKIQRNYLELHLVDKGSVDGYLEIWAKLFHEQTHLFVQNSYRMWDFLLMTCMRILIPLFSACTCYFQNYNINLCYLDGKEKAEYRGKGRTGKKQCTVDSLYLEHPLSRTSLYVELKSQSLCLGCNMFLSLYLELSLSRTNSLIPCEFEIERVSCT